MKNITVAIDGPAGAGKSSVAKAVAQQIGANYLDTGSMYRAVALYLMREGVDLQNAAAVAERCVDAPVRVRYESGVQHTCLGDEDVSLAVRSEECSFAASQVSAVPQVREYLVALQQKIAEGESVVMDGRDIGTKVLPNATVKIFLTARAEVRAQRRYDELVQKGEPADFDTVLKDIVDRDYQDTHRAASPLVRAEDATEVDTSELTLDEVVAEIRRIVRAAV